MASFLKITLQLAVYILIYLLASAAVNYFSLPLPANIVGMLLMFILVLSGIVPVRLVKRGSAFLLSEMLLFFIPAVVAIVNYFDVLAEDGGRILAVIALSTLLVLSATAWVVDKLFSYENRRLLK
ncbi:CidA/LrgA family protein [Intestinirhabdus alba]|jgi:holin-like protein|uniref:CidA/LrgA family protein n=1 Tax=Intestinirhabdus alba TaxID=2899544 RepID=A0A6L6ILF3_9ENTR|nr:CidA/LrgA family protein [Intestinirhabdus alba]MTH46717.1 CidA/LrgA family protein [Intestinirhabdus alba]